jgi:hypothetical protein
MHAAHDLSQAYAAEGIVALPVRHLAAVPAVLALVG